MIGKKLHTIVILAAGLAAGIASAAPRAPGFHSDSGCPIYMRDGAQFDLQFSRGGEVTVKSRDGKVTPAPDGFYTGPDGKQILVKDGKQMPTDQKALSK